MQEKEEEEKRTKKRKTTKNEEEDGGEEEDGSVEDVEGEGAWSAEWILRQLHAYQGLIRPNSITLTTAIQAFRNVKKERKKDLRSLSISFYEDRL